MRIWPSKMLRDSFKDEYLRQVEWNLRRMKSEKQKMKESSSNEHKLLENGGGVGGEVASCSNSVCEFIRQLGRSVIVISCTYCCFCCGVCMDEEDMI
ncbi:hypothetical protein SAY87_002669 [Trapa incisa]|uniref:Uncharacterized protein n=2 Tax=Trapa TaxID=22665 RepID=A0AAN7KKK8_TRANT|nr:hypothetical protein SAY87_002669 [Trapa incisa]KAK4764680.1 hypothetical protein SAY86_025770 [Trapa natans]